MKKAEVSRDGEVVTIEVRCSEIYEAMQLYDEVTNSLNEGCLTLTVITPFSGKGRDEEGA